MRFYLLMFGCLLLPISGCSELPAPDPQGTNAHAYSHCANHADPACGPPANISLAEIFR